ncbi:MAG TPA: contractile injection system protein, VgrG/Pvc8 family [Thermoanaerobaculia bacterium]|nr:contractile injection system protein, VgrG/Pvc8 family [Thermoanaerobaculia bacterium]
MAENGATEGLAPEVRLRVGGADVPLEAEADVIEASVLQDVSAPGMFAVRLMNWDVDKLQFTWSDDPLFAEGGEVEVLMGYAGDLAPVFVGEVTGLEPEFNADETPTVTIRGYDRRHRLMRGRKTRSFTQVKDSDIASQVAQDAGLSAEAEDTQVPLDYVLQHNQTDLEFLETRARRIGFEVWVEGKTLHFRPRPVDESEVATLHLEEDLLEFYPRASTVGLAGAFEARGWNVKDKEALLGEAAASDAGSTMGGKTLGVDVAEQAFGAAVGAAVDQAPLSQGEADQIAKGQMKEMALSYVTGEGVATGRYDLKAGTVVKIEGCGQRFSGLYYLSSVRHTYTTRRGYRTAFTVRRNAT